MGSFLAATAVDVVLVLLVLAIPSLRPRDVNPKQQLVYSPIYTSPVEWRATIPRERVPVPRVAALKAPVFRAPVMPAPTFPVPRAKVAPRHVRMVEAPVVKQQFRAPPNHKRDLPRLKQPIHTGVLAASVAEATTRERPAKVQTGGFGDPLGAPTAPTAHRSIVIDPIGSFDTPVGPGKGNGTGGSRGTRGVIAEAGFGDAVATPAESHKARPGESVHAGVFSNLAAAPLKSEPVHHTAKPTIQPVQILQKSNPVYTAEARAHKIEGDVLLEVIFAANGTVDVLRVVSGLGYGLDQSAISAARRIRFRPERVDGKPVDARARLRIVFRLAY